MLIPLRILVSYREMYRVLEKTLLGMRQVVSVALVLVAVSTICTSNAYQIGVGIADVTGPTVQV